MKKFLSLFLLIGVGVSFGFSQTKEPVKFTETQKLELNREKFDPTRNSNQDLADAVTKAKKEKKRIILDIGGEWCGWCRRMDFYFMQNKSLAKLRGKNFVWVKINMSEENENKEFLATYPEIPGYPHLYVLEKDGSFLYSKSTSELEEGKSYNLQRFTNFIKKWSPAKKAKK